MDSMNEQAEQDRSRYADIVKAHEAEDYRQDMFWILEIEALPGSHLIRGVALPPVYVGQGPGQKGKLVPQPGDHARVVFNLSNVVDVERKMAAWMAEGAKECKAALYMLKGSAEVKVDVASTWVLEGFRPVSMQLQNFDRKGEAGIAELLVQFAFDSVTVS